MKKKPSATCSLYATAARTHFVQGKREVLEFVVKRDSNLGDFPSFLPVFPFPAAACTPTCPILSPSAAWGYAYMLRVHEMRVHVQSHSHAGLGMRLVEQPPPRVPHTKYPVHAELPHLKYVVLDITVFQRFLLRVCCKYKCVPLLQGVCVEGSWNRQARSSGGGWHPCQRYYCVNRRHRRH